MYIDLGGRVFLPVLCVLSAAAIRNTTILDKLSNCLHTQSTEIGCKFKKRKVRWTPTKSRKNHIEPSSRGYNRTTRNRNTNWLGLVGFSSWLPWKGLAPNALPIPPFFSSGKLVGYVREFTRFIWGIYQNFYNLPKTPKIKFLNYNNSWKIKLIKVTMITENLVFGPRESAGECPFQHLSKTLLPTKSSLIQLNLLSLPSSSTHTHRI